MSSLRASGLSSSPTSHTWTLGAHTVTSPFSAEFPKKPGSQSGAQEVKILLDLNQPLLSYVALANDLISLFKLAPPVKCRLTTAGFPRLRGGHLNGMNVEGWERMNSSKCFLLYFKKNQVNIFIRGAAKWSWEYVVPYCLERFNSKLPYSIISYSSSCIMSGKLQFLCSAVVEHSAKRN